MPQTAASPIAYSYLRFSRPEQADGDSIRRQSEAAAAWCRRNGIGLDSSVTLRDLGKSAFTGAHRLNPDRHAMAAFLKLVHDGRIPRGSYLVIENLDRLSREEERPALRLWMDILDAGINIVQLTPETLFRHEKSDMFDVMRAIMELSRGHNESAVKSERLTAAWRQKKKLARESGAVMTSRTPGWIEATGGKFRLIAERARIVRRVFALSAQGYGAARIVKTLTEDGAVTFGRSGKWSRAYVGYLLVDRRALGEFQPRTAAGEPDGEPIANYYPAAVGDQEFYAAQASRGGRKLPRGQAGKRVELFSGLLRNAADGGGTFSVTTRVNRWHGGAETHRVLINSAALHWTAPCVSFPLLSFERAVLSLLREIDPREILAPVEQPSEALELAAQKAAVEGRISELEEALLDGDVPSVVRKLRELEGKRKALALKLAQASRESASPLPEAWGEARTLLAALDAAAEPLETRVRLRSVLRRLVESVWLLVVPRGRDRLCAVQVRFAGGGLRDYLILHRSKKGRAGRPSKPEAWFARSLSEDAAAAGDLDLRQPAHALALAARLEALDLAAAFPEGEPS